LTEIEYIFMRCGYSYRVFASYSTIDGQDVLRNYIADKMEERSLMLQISGIKLESDPVFSEYRRNLQRNKRDWLQQNK